MRARTAIVGLVVVAVVVAVNVWASSSSAQVDWSASRRFTLSRESREIAARVDRPLHITAFLYEGGGAARDARFLLERYHEHNGDITYEVVDPDAKPSEARRFGITGYSTVVVEYAGRRVDAAAVDEIQISSALLRVLRGDRSVICLLTGHGEASPDDEGAEGLSALATLLDNNAYDLHGLDLTTGGHVPADCDAVAIFGARTAFSPDERIALDTYTRAAGRLLVFASPFFAEADPNALLQPWGITFVGGLAVDPDRSETLDLSNVIVTSFPSSNPVVDGVPSLQMPAPGGLLVDLETRPGLTVSRLATTSDNGFIETNPDTELEFSEGDFPGPVVLAAAADDSRVEERGEQRVRGDGPQIVRTRVLATGNDLMATNQFIDRLGNRRFLLNAFAWLTEQEQLLTVGAAPPQPRDLPWTNERQRQVVGVAVIGVPLLVLAVGLGQWWFFRRRSARIVA